jgi:hypothetical protein
MLSVLPKDLLRHLCGFLWWTEVVAVKATSRGCRDALLGSRLLDVRAIVREQLIQATDGSAANADTILRLLVASGNQMTGSFVLQAMSGGVKCPWRDTVADIDVLVPPLPSATPFPSDYEKQLEYVSPEGEYERAPAHSLVAWNMRRDAHIRTVYMRRRGGRGGRGGISGHYAEFAALECTRESPFDYAFAPPLSFTHVGQETGRNSVEASALYAANRKAFAATATTATFRYASLADFVAREADFAFCQVLFDGIHIKVRNWQAVWTRSAQVKARDFRLLPFYEWGNNGHAIVSHLLGRCDKYQARGFQVVTDVPESEEGRNQLNDDILAERDLTLVYLHRFEEGVPRSSVEPHVLRSYDRWVAGGCRGNWHSGKVEAEEAEREATNGLGSLPSSCKLQDSMMATPPIDEVRKARAAHRIAQAGYRALARARALHKKSLP